MQLVTSTVTQQSGYSMGTWASSGHLTPKLRFFTFPKTYQAFDVPVGVVADSCGFIF